MRASSYWPFSDTRCQYCSGRWPACSHCRDRAAIAALPCTFSGPGHGRRGRHRSCPGRSRCRPGRACRRFHAEFSAPPGKLARHLSSCPAKPELAISFRLRQGHASDRCCRQMASACSSLRSASSGLFNILVGHGHDVQAGGFLLLVIHLDGQSYRRGLEDRDCLADRRS